MEEQLSMETTQMAKKTPGRAVKRYKHSLAGEGSKGALARRETGMTTDKDTTAVEKPLSSRVQHLVNDVRADFRDFTTELGAVAQSRLAVAPKFMKAYRAYASETAGPEKGKFLAFVRLLDPTVPADREGYRNHPSYQAAGYLRQIEALASLESIDPPKTLPATPLVALSRVVAMILPVVKDTDAFWSAFKTRLHWNEAQIERLQNHVKNQRELVKVTGTLAPAPTLVKKKD